MSRTRAHYIDKTGKTVVSAEYWDPKPFEGHVARVSSPDTGRAGVIDREGRVVVDFIYDHIEPFYEGVARVNLGGTLHKGVVQGGVFGFIAKDGREVVVPEYVFAREADDGRITVCVDDKFGFLDTQGNVVVPPTYEYATWHTDGLAVVGVDGLDGYVDKDGKLVIQPRFDEATVFKHGLARVKIDGLWGIINKRGEIVHDCLFERTGELKNGSCWAVQDGKCYVLTPTGDILGDRWFDEIRQAEEDDIWPIRDGDKWAFLRPDGAVIATGLDGALAFTEGLGRGKRNDKWGFVNARGEWRIPSQYDDAWSFEEGRAAVKGETGWRFITSDGVELGPKNLSFGNRFRDGMAPVQVDGEWGFLNLRGDVAIEPSFNWVGYFAEGLAAALTVDDETVPIAADRVDAHVMPPGGLTHPVFEDADTDSHLIAVIGFDRHLDARESARLKKLVQAYERGIHYTGKLYSEDKWVSTFNIYVRLQNLLDPIGAVSLLVDELFTADLPINELLYARWGTPPRAQAMQPTADPRMPMNMQAVFADFHEFWRAVWSHAGATPAPENYFYLKGALAGPDGALTLEERHTPMWFPDVKLCMGVLQGHGEKYSKPDEQSLRVEDALVDAIQHRWSNIWVKPGTKRHIPVPLARDGNPGLERITYEGRRGYAFGFDCGSLLHWFSTPRMRFREPELMDAIRLVVRALDLEPVILWGRFAEPIEDTELARPTMMMINIFEKPRSQILG